MAESVTNLFRTMLLVQLFFSFAMTAIVYYIPDDAKNLVTSFSDVAGDIDLDTVGTEVQDALTRQTNIPVIDVGALVFYSGNILLDLMLNFAFAIPEMLGLIIYGLQSIITMPAYMVALTELFVGVTVISLYFISLIQLITGIRSGRIL